MQADDNRSSHFPAATPRPSRHRTRPWLVVASAAIVCAVVATAGAARTAVTPAQLSVLVLPRPAFGPDAAKLPIDSSSGVSSNKDYATSSIDPAINRAYIAKIGRVSGYELTFTGPNALTAKSGLISAGSGVSLFKTGAGAALLLHRLPADLQHRAGKGLGNGLTLSALTLFSPGKIGDAAVGFRAEVRFGGVHFWTTSVGVEVGTLLVTVNLSRADGTDENATAARLARALSQRVADVLAGRIHPTPVPLPTATKAKLGGLGRPAGGPDLSTMALRPSDFSPVAAITKQGYQRNSNDVAEYERDFDSGRFQGTQLSSVTSQVELLPSSNDAQGYFGALRTGLSGPRGRQLLEQLTRQYAKKSLKMTFAFEPESAFSAGDAAFAVGARAVAGGFHLRLIIAFVRVGPVVTSVILVTEPGALTPGTLTALLRVAAKHVHTSLR